MNGNVISIETSDVARLVRTARSLLAKGGNLESALDEDPIAETRLKTAVARHVQDGQGVMGAEISVTAKTVAADVIASAQSALQKANEGQAASTFTEFEVASLEAIIQITGRPAMRYADGRVAMPASELGENERWRVLVATARSKINRASASVGQLALNRPGLLAEQVGSAWRLGDDLLVTNRHVVRKLVRNPNEPAASWKIDPAKPSFVDFAVTDNAGASQRFTVTEVVYCAEEEFIDFAALRLRVADTPLPPALTIEWSRDALGSEIARTGEQPKFKGEEIYIVGHPYRQYASDATTAVFGTADGRKRCSPGFVVQLDSSAPVLEHDCSTLGGNSGSCVLSVGRHTAVGLHFGGRDVNQATGLGDANLALALSRLGSHKAAEVLRTGRV